MLVEIDDAGLGSPVGGLVIGGRKGNNFSHVVIPVTVFQKNEEMDPIKVEVKKAVESLLKALKFDPLSDEIFICQGDIFSHARSWFDEMGYKYSVGKIKSPLQDYVETAFDLHLTTLGVPRGLIRSFKDYKDYSFILFKWAVISKNEREKYVKTRFKSWRTKWSNAEIRKQRVKLKRGAICVNCGEEIGKGEEACMYNILAGGKVYRAFTHLECCV